MLQLVANIKSCIAQFALSLSKHNYYCYYCGIPAVVLPTYYFVIIETGLKNCIAEVLLYGDVDIVMPFVESIALVEDAWSDFHVVLQVPEKVHLINDDLK